MQPEEEIVIEPFDPTKLLAHLRALDEKNPPMFTGIARLGNDDERVRDGAQRESYWVAQIAHLQEAGDTDEMMAHAKEELSNALFVQGKLAEAIELSSDPGYYETIQTAIERDDDEFCDCPETETVNSVLVGGKPGVSQLWTIVGYYPSQKHGRMMPIQQCAKCGFMNVTNL